MIFFIASCSNIESKKSVQQNKSEIDTSIVYAIDLGNEKYSSDKEPYVLKHEFIEATISPKLVVRVKKHDIALAKSKIYYEALTRNYDYDQDTLRQLAKNTDEMHIRKEIDNAFKNESFEEMLMGIHHIQYLLKDNILILDVSVDILNMPHKATFGIDLKKKALKWCYVEDLFLGPEEAIYIKKDLIYLGVDYNDKKPILLNIHSGQRVFK
ncbi:MAG: hypothetical protein MUC49_06680 [Raineya sp.]|jgi:hypothetical protein|nr:hypothetical protein [Raineya sp.]